MEDQRRSSDAPGQQKPARITNATTGETKVITNEEWRTNGKQLRAEGWTRVDDEGETEPEPPAE